MGTKGTVEICIFLCKTGIRSNHIKFDALNTWYKNSAYSHSNLNHNIVIFDGYKCVL
jgi:hypothetical protein